MDSAILRSLSRIWAGILAVIYDSRSYKVFSAISSYLKNAAHNSLILGYFIKPSKDAEPGIFQSKLYSLGKGKEGILKSTGRFIGRTIRRSSLACILYDFYSNILFIPMRSFGLMSVTAGSIYIILTGILSEIGPRSIFASALLVSAGLLMMLFKSGIHEILNDSIAVRLISGRPEVLSLLNLSDRRKNQNHYILMIILGALIALFPVMLPTFYAAAAIAALLVVPLIFVWPVLGLLILVISIAFIPTMAAAGLILLTWIAVIVNCALGRMTLSGVLKKGRPVLLFIFITLIGGIISFAVADSIRIALIYTVFISSVYLFISMIKDKVMFKTTLILSGAAAFLTAVYGMYQYLTGNIQAGWIDSEMFAGIVRIYSTFENPNVYGEYLLFMIPIALVFFFSSRRFIYKLFWLGAGLAMVAAMLLTMSRGCWIGLAAGVFIYFLIADRRYLWLFFAAVVVLPFVLPESIMFRLLSIGNLEDSSSLYRLFIWLGTFRMLGDYWLTGIGLGTKAFSGIYSAYAYNGILAPHPHNLYLNIMSESGITGLICLGLITIKSLKYSISNAISANGRELKHAGAAIAAAFTGILIQGVFDNVFYNYRIVLIFWIFTALAFVFQNIMKDETEEPNG